MIVHPLTDLATAPDMGMLFGNYAPSHVLQSINQRMGSERLHFGHIGERFGQLFNTFDNMFVKTINMVKDKVRHTKKIIEGVTHMIPIITEEDLFIVPDHMYVPILAYEPMRTMHEQGRIDGWGITPSQVPTDDPWGNVLGCGYVETDPITGEFPEKVYWTQTTEDPEMTDEEIDALRETRRFMDVFMARELHTSGTQRDPTGMCDGLYIGELR